MAMSDCEKCWDTPCMCGYNYRNWVLPDRMKLAAAVLGVPLEKIENLSGILPKQHPQKESETRK